MGHIDEMLVSKIGANRIEQNSLPVGAIVGSAVTAGTAIADSTAAVTMDSTAFGQTFTSAHNDQVNLALVNTGVIVLSTGAGNSLSANSVFCGGAATVIRPAAAANNQITITGADTNSAFGPGSTITATVVAAGKYLVEIVMVPLGTGSDAIAVATA